MYVELHVVCMHVCMWTRTHVASCEQVVRQGGRQAGIGSNYVVS